MLPLVDGGCSYMHTHNGMRRVCDVKKYGFDVLVALSKLLP